jgi:hypothetical protein
MKERRESEHMRVEEEERYQAQIVATVLVVELGSPWQVGNENRPVDLEVQHSEVTPVC